MLKLTCLGDIMCDNKMSENIECYYNESQKKYSFESMFENLEELLGYSDYVLANLETPISYNNDDLTKRQWEFCSPYEFAAAIKKCGIDFVSTANNHCLDRGIEGLEATIKSLNKIDIDHCGIRSAKEENNYVLTNVKGIRLGICTYTYGTNAFSNKQYLPFRKMKLVNLLQEQEGSAERFWKRLFHGHFGRVFNRLSRLFYPQNIGKPIYERETLHHLRKLFILHDLRKLRNHNPDYIIAYLHIGGQYNEKPSCYTRKMVEWFAKHGCNAVIANHEHVVHGMEFDGDKIKAFALGNCVSGAGLLDVPYDRKSEYSIAVHIYLNEKTATLNAISFSVLKTIKKDNGTLEVWPAKKLLEKTPEPEYSVLTRDILEIAKVFSGNSYSKVLAEFPVYSVETSFVF